MRGFVPCWPCCGHAPRRWWIFTTPGANVCDRLRRVRHPARCGEILERPLAILGHLKTLGARLASLAEFSHATAEAETRRLAEELAIKPGAIMSAARVALTGQAVSPGLFDVMLVLGQQKTAARLAEVGV